MVDDLRRVMNSFDVAAVVNELKSILPGMRIDNIYQLNSKIMLFRLKKPGGENVNLLIEAGVRIHITMYQLEKPKVPPVFAMALRKYLRNRTIRDVRQHEFERIVIIEIEGKDGVYNLICELFGEGNIILVSPEGLILHALKFKRMKDRDLIRGKKFRFPPSSGLNPRKLRRDDIFKLKEYDSLEIVKALTRFLSIGGLNSEEILKRAE
ncbi:TPA: fibronectin-binding domain-containing protein, partial [Candidatus Bathyarchaeota archaeon]|nr:fibronectin-binding domain-containing protein [Candidatus Bathyarchaeota archaeon]